MSYLRGVRHAWLTPGGRLHPVCLEGHDSYAYDLEECGAWPNTDRLEWEGYLRLSGNEWSDRNVTQAQLNVIFDWHVENEIEFNPKGWKVK